jgi:DNA-binding NarL/FixJ family response regulator
VLDLVLPGCDRFDLLADLRRDWPDIPVLVLSATSDRATVELALDLGTMGFIPKTANVHTLIDALRRVLSGDRSNFGHARGVDPCVAEPVLPQNCSRWSRGF